MKKKDSMANVEQGSFRDGFISSFSMILLAEIADKTFFIACIMAMRYRLVYFHTVFNCRIPKKQTFLNPHTPVAQKSADEVVFRHFQGEGVEFF